MAAVVEALNGVWVPQRDAVIFRRELLPVDVERLIYWHDGRKVEVYLSAQLSGRIRYTYHDHRIGRQMACYRLESLEKGASMQ